MKKERNAKQQKYCEYFAKFPKNFSYVSRISIKFACNFYAIGFINVDDLIRRILQVNQIELSQKKTIDNQLDNNRELFYYFYYSHLR